MTFEHRNALPYYGGKALLARWIAPLTTQRVTYIEPFAGMASVLLRRPKAETELINDKAEHVVNWWRVVRDRADELHRLLVWTPHSRSERSMARAMMDDPGCDPVWAAWAFTVMATQSMANALGKDGSWRHRYMGKNVERFPEDRLWKIRERIVDVQLDCRDAGEVLAAAADKPEVMIYCDPPYPTANNEAYLAQVGDRAAMADLFLSQAGDVAVSGYDGDWPELDAAGWLREVKPWSTSVRTEGKQRPPRTEVLWMNYQPPVHQASMF